MSFFCFVGMFNLEYEKWNLLIEKKCRRVRIIFIKWSMEMTLWDFHWNKSNEFFMSLFSLRQHLQYLNLKQILLKIIVSLPNIAEKRTLNIDKIVFVFSLEMFFTILFSWLSRMNKRSTAPMGEIFHYLIFNCSRKE